MQNFYNMEQLCCTDRPRPQQNTQTPSVHHASDLLEACALCSGGSPMSQMSQCTWNNIANYDFNCQIRVDRAFTVRATKL